MQKELTKHIIDGDILKKCRKKPFYYNNYRNLKTN